MLINLAKLFFIIGIIFLLTAGLIYVFARAGLSIREIPGNIRIEGNNFTCIIALGVSILLSVLLTIMLNIIVRILNK